MSALFHKPLNQGQMLLSILIAIAIFSILAHALFTLVATSYDLITFNKSRITARQIAQEKIETIRNLPYDDVATIGGIPPGTVIPQIETINRNGLNYTVKTDIIYIDDPYDGVAPEDLAPEDYKRVRVEVSWEGLASSGKNPIVILTDVSSQTSAGLGGGTLVVLVLDANGDPVPQAQVNIVASTISPAVDITQSTNNNGRVTLPGATECIECYEITVSKEGMNTDKTYSNADVTNPLKPHASILSNQVTQISFAIDTLGSMNITSRNSREDNFTILGNVPFRLRGNKIIGTDALTQPVYKYDQILTTGAGGDFNLAEMEWDIYHIIMPSITSYDISGTSPLLPLNLAPGGDLDFTFSVTPHTSHSLFLTIKDPTQSLIASASAHLTGSGGFDESKTTGLSENPDYGQVIFPSLNEDNYTLTATASGFQDFNSDYDISGYTKGEVVLTPE